MKLTFAFISFFLMTQINFVVKMIPPKNGHGVVPCINNKFSEGITQIPTYSCSYICSGKYFDLHNYNACWLKHWCYCWTSKSSLTWLKYGWSQNWLKSTARCIHSMLDILYLSRERLPPELCNNRRHSRHPIFQKEYTCSCALLSLQCK